MWNYWSTRELQEEIGERNLDFFEKVIPELSTADNFGTFVGNRSKLAALVESLKDHDYFRKTSNLERCLYRVPQDKLNELCNGLKLEGERVDMRALAKKVLSNDDHYNFFLRVFKLDDRFKSANHAAIAPFFDNLSATIEHPKIILKPFKNLKNYQVECFANVINLIKAPMARAILQMPTGSGKTRTACEVLAEHLNEPGIRQVVWLANVRELCEQALQCMSEVWDHLGRRDCRFNRIWDGNLEKIPTWHEKPCVFSVMSLQSGWSLLNENPASFSELFKGSTLVVVDEAHVAVAPTYSAVIKGLAQVSDCKVLGLTATPGRTITEEITELSDLFFGEICSLQDPNKTRNNAIAYLRSIGVMSEAFHQVIKAPTSLSITRSDIMSSDYSKRILETLGLDAYRTIEVIQKLRNLLDQGAKIILFAPSVQNSFLTSSILAFLGYKSIHVSGATPPRTRDVLIGKFLNDEYQIMCNYGVLATGFDAPNVDVVCIARPTLSPVLYSQMIGRGLRGEAVGGTSQCVILEVIDNFNGHADQDGLYRKFNEYWSN